MFTSIRVASGRSPVTVVGVFAKAEGAPRGTGLDARGRARVADAIATPGFRGDAGEMLATPGGELVVGLGKKEELKTETLRTVGGRLARRLDRMKARAARLEVTAGIPAKVARAHDVGRLLGEGLGLANWRVDFFDGKATRTPAARPALSVTASTNDVRAGLREGLVLAAAANEARRVAATPPNICNPPWIAREARRLAKAHGLTCRVISYAEAKKLGMGGIVNVGKGSAAKPCMVILEHKPARAKKGVKVALVGKTMTYDTGGYSLKISNSMKGMKYDGNGGCAVLGTMLALADLKVPVHTVGLLPAAENMVAADSYRPDDIISMYNDVSVEVTNTDAEGRLILGDALAYACKRLKPTTIIDTATLTGGVVVALGKWSAGLFCNDDPLRRRIEEAADATGERVWTLPLWEEHRDFMRAKHADIWNSGPKRDGHPIQGAAFLSYFVDDEIPWAHIDIAGVSDVDSNTPLHVAGPTGFGVRLLTETVRSYC
ncbi:MAG: leucyl aminopeptidase family protein [Planctomycetes bacterium]|nr:leucyl aminopeptidase family protein [Planctomycetota bacterium]